MFNPESPSRRHYLVECSEHSTKNVLVVTVIAIATIYEVLSTWLPLIDLPIALNLPRFSPLWTIVVVLVAILFIVIEGGYQKSVTKQWKHDEVVSQLQDRLTPKLAVNDFRITPTPTQGAGPCVYVQLVPVCLTDSPVDNCAGFLLQIRKWIQDRGEWKTEFDEPLPLGWSIYGEFSPVNLKPGVNHRLNVFWFLRDHGSFCLCNITTPLRIVDLFNRTDIFRFDIKLTATNCKSVDVCLQAKWGDTWDRPLVEIVNDAAMPPIVCIPRSTIESA